MELFKDATKTGKLEMLLGQEIGGLGSSLTLPQ